MFDLSTPEGRQACIAQGPKVNCLVLDFAKNTERLGPINDPRKPKAKKKDAAPGDAPVKVCGNCLTYNNASARICSECGSEFQFSIKMEQAASRAELIAASIAERNQPPITEWFDVLTIQASKHTPWNGRVKGPFNTVRSSLRMTYNCAGTRSFQEYICLEHEDGNHAKTAALQWWAKTCPSVKCPQTVTEALRRVDAFRQPNRIKVWVNRENPKITYREFIDETDS